MQWRFTKLKVIGFEGDLKPRKFLGRPFGVAFGPVIDPMQLVDRLPGTDGFALCVVSGLGIAPAPAYL